jgi:hypothetical protein
VIRGLWNHGGVLYQVQNDTLYSVDSHGLRRSRGALNSTAGRVDFSSNLTQLVINDGSYLYVYTPAADSFVAVSYAGGDRIGVVGQRLCYLFRGTQKFGWSDLANAASLPVLNYDSANSSPDALVALIPTSRELQLLGSDSCEIWDVTSDPDAPFSVSSAQIEQGCAAAHSAQRLGEATIFLAKDRDGQATVQMMLGHEARRVSTRAEEEAFEGLDLSQSYAFTWSEGQNGFYALNVPGVATTRVFDTFSGEWHERSAWVRGRHAKWKPTCCAAAYGLVFFGDADDNLLISDRDAHTYNGEPKVRERIAPVFTKPGHDRVAYSRFEVIAERGTSGKAMLRWQNEVEGPVGRWHYADMGETGQVKGRAMFQRLGSALDRVFHLRYTHPSPFNPVLVNIAHD